MPNSKASILATAKSSKTMTNDDELEPDIMLLFTFPNLAKIKTAQVRHITTEMLAHIPT